MEKLLKILVHFYDQLHKIWEHKSTHNLLSSILVLVFVFSLLLVLLSDFLWIPQSVRAYFPHNIFHAIEISFTLVLMIEVIGLVFSLSYSVTASLVKQLEILSLILLRSAFKQFGEFYKIENWADYEPVVSMIADAFGALLIFIIILLINKTLKHTPITDDPERQTRFVMFKKIMGLFLFFSFLFSGLYDIGLYIQHAHPFDFFKNFYTILIFSDIFLVLLSMRYNYSYIIVFRNSAFAVATIIIRMALSAPIYYNIALGVLSALFVLSISFFYTKFRHCDAKLHAEGM
ncbi:MAG: hypothetical protein B7C24_07605 [Bacteroidetes bacterium 4572_77]|nr:MAG: hypothetical protein B7C24_07605 [Bacteroidetes bacterium 4572_77]